MRRYPWAPLAALVGPGIGKKLNVHGSTFKEYRDRGMSPRVADRLATKAGYHPAEVWPTWVADALEDHGRDCKECGTRFLPAKGHQVFCDGPCRHRFHSREANRRLRSTPEGRAANAAKAKAWRQSLGPAAQRAVAAKNREASRRWWQSHPEAQVRHRELRRQRYWTDPAYRERILEAQRARDRAKAAS